MTTGLAILVLIVVYVALDLWLLRRDEKRLAAEKDDTDEAGA